MAASKPKSTTKRKPRPRPMTMAQQTFCHEFALHENASEAFRVAYPSSRKWKPETVNQQACRVSKNPRIIARVEELVQRKRSIANKKFDVSAERVIQELAALAFSNSDDFFHWGMHSKPLFTRDGKPIIDAATGKQATKPVPMMIIKPSSQLTREQKAAIAGVETSIARDGTPVVSIRLADKRGALRDLAMHLGLFQHVERVQHAHAHAVVHVDATVPVGDKKLALRRFEELRLQLQALPAPKPEIIGAVPAAA
jgi:phage terminase small subunit